MRVVVVSTYELLSRQAATMVAESIRRKPDVTLGLPTGNTPVGLYAELVRMHREEDLDFSAVRTFNLDEYAGLEPSHPKSYHAYMKRHFFDHVNVSADRIRIPNGSPDIDAAAESVRHEDAIRDAGGIDLLIVGIGANGHIAFNEPGSSKDSRTRLVNLAPETRVAARRHFNRDEDVPHSAITMGVATILEARRIVLLIHGSTKLWAADCALHGPITEDCPASLLKTHADVTAFADFVVS